MKPLRIILDTNLFVSILLGSKTLAPLETFVRNGRARLIISPAQIGELTEVLRRPHFKFEPDEMEALLDWIKSDAILVTPQKIPKPVSRDPKDDFLLAAAVAGKADALVTGDKDLLVLGSYEGIPIMTSSKFLTVA